MEKSPLPRSSSGKDLKKRQRYERRRATSEDPGKRSQEITKQNSGDLIISKTSNLEGLSRTAVIHDRDQDNGFFTLIDEKEMPFNQEQTDIGVKRLRHN